jgi:general secretion pathway protein K
MTAPDDTPPSGQDSGAMARERNASAQDATLEDGRMDRGWALVSTLWALTVLALMAAAAASLTVTTYRSEGHETVDARAEAGLDASIVRAALGISDARPSRRWPVDNRIVYFAYDDLRIGVTVQDELGRIDLNSATGPLITQLLLGAGLERGEAEALSDRILDWRSASRLETLNGGTDDDYRVAHLPYTPRHGPFQTVDELRLVLGMRPGLFRKLRPALTVYSKKMMFEPSLAPREALWALYPTDPSRAEDVLRTRQGDGLDANHVGLAPGALATVDSLAGRAYCISAEVTIGARHFARQAVIEFTGDVKRPYYVLSWQ